MRIHAILNRRAGTIIGAGTETFEHKLGKVFGDAGHSINIEVVEPDAIGEAVKRAAAQGYDALIVGGGDGSVNAAATVLVDTPTALGILPLGTMNRMARDLNLSMEVDQALQQLATAEPKLIDVAEVNGKLFLCNSFIGLPPMITEKRQELRGGTLAERLRGYAAMPVAIARGARRIALLIDDRDSPRLHRALTVVVSNNLYSESPSLLPKRRALDEGHLGLYISKHRTVTQTLWLLVKASLGRWSGDPDFEGQAVEKVTITSSGKRLRVANDGELLWLTSPLEYRIRPKALTVLAPKAEPA
ncbi:MULTISPECIES: diacylglycerol kinase family protein [Rhodomicrobium]|uniref:diacylglycerol/lipid kinase family protein n=1 Tax=Rhodomicrobium TaxID=1068 RepID=UPI001481F13A|nr:MULTISPECIES: diacylglycerol kinase family protein [Rhodomicrobium]